jgi:hypothetical protein
MQASLHKQPAAPSDSRPWNAVTPGFSAKAVCRRCLLVPGVTTGRGKDEQNVIPSKPTPLGSSDWL